MVLAYLSGYIPGYIPGILLLSWLYPWLYSWYITAAKALLPMLLGRERENQQGVAGVVIN